VRGALARRGWRGLLEYDGARVCGALRHPRAVGPPAFARCARSSSRTCNKENVKARKRPGEGGRICKERGTFKTDHFAWRNRFP